MQPALNAADEASRLGEVPVGAALYRWPAGVSLLAAGGLEEACVLSLEEPELLARRGNERELSSDPTAHAEVLVLREFAERSKSWRLDDCVLFVSLEPCVMCAGALVNARLGALVFGAFDAKGGAVGSLYNICQDPRLNHRMPVFGGVRADECGELLKSFFRQRRQQSKELKKSRSTLSSGAADRESLE